MAGQTIEPLEAVRMFVAECCEVDSACKELTHHTYKAYEKWYRFMGVPERSKEFFRLLAIVTPIVTGIRFSKAGSKFMVVEGIRLLDSPMGPTQIPYYN